MAERDQAIAYCEEHRANHYEWRNYWAHYHRPWYVVLFKRLHRFFYPEHSGSPESALAHHIESIRRYDLIIRMLRG